MHAPPWGKTRQLTTPQADFFHPLFSPLCMGWWKKSDDTGCFSTASCNQKTKTRPGEGNNGSCICIVCPQNSVPNKHNSVTVHALLSPRSSSSSCSWGPKASMPCSLAAVQIQPHPYNKKIKINISNSCYKIMITTHTYIHTHTFIYIHTYIYISSILIQSNIKGLIKSNKKINLINSN